MDEEMYENPFPEDDDPGEELARMAQETIESQSAAPDAINARRRCERVLELYEQGHIQNARDTFHASLVMLYGDRPTNYELAHTLAARAAELGEQRAWTLQAMALDRWLLSVGRPQRFGTQIIKQAGRWSLGEIDDKVSDSERAMYGVPPLFVQQQRAQQLQRQEEQEE
jgi:hypothetical protein